MSRAIEYVKTLTPVYCTFYSFSNVSKIASILKIEYNLHDFVQAFCL